MSKEFVYMIEASLEVKRYIVLKPMQLVVVCIKFNGQNSCIFCLLSRPMSHDEVFMVQGETPATTMYCYR